MPFMDVAELTPKGLILVSNKTIFVFGKGLKVELGIGVGVGLIFIEGTTVGTIIGVVVLKIVWDGLTKDVGTITTDGGAIIETLGGDVILFTGVEYVLGTIDPKIGDSTAGLEFTLCSHE